MKSEIEKTSIWIHNWLGGSYESITFLKHEVLIFFIKLDHESQRVHRCFESSKEEFSQIDGVQLFFFFECTYCINYETKNQKRKQRPKEMKENLFFVVFINGEASESVDLEAVLRHIDIGNATKCCHFLYLSFPASLSSINSLLIGQRMRVFTCQRLNSVLATRIILLFYTGATCRQ